MVNLHEFALNEWSPSTVDGSIYGGLISSFSYRGGIFGSLTMRVGWVSLMYRGMIALVDF